MPRYAINLDPFARQTDPASDALTNAVAQVTAAIERRRTMEAERDERDLMRGEQRTDRDYSRQRQERMDALTIDDRDYRRTMDERRLTLEDEDRSTRANDRQLNIERQANQDQRLADRDSLDLFKMNEDLDYRDTQAAERQIQNMNIEDARRDATEARTEATKVRGDQRARMTFKDARSLALDEAKARAGKNAMGYARPVDPKLVEDLTQQFMDQGDEPAEGAPKMLPYRSGDRQPVDPAAKRVLSILDGPEEVAQAPAAPPAPAPTAAVPAAAPVADDPSQSTLAKIAGYLNPMAGTAMMVRNLISPADAAPTQAPAEPVNPNAPDPDPKYIDQMEQLSQASPENFKKILRELKAKHPEEYAATVRMLSQRAAGAGSVASAQ